MKNVLIIQTAFLGDVILATPVASELKRLYPNISIDFLVKKGNESLLTNHVDIRTTYVFDKSQKWKSIRSLVRKFRSNKYDLVINLHRFGSSGIIAGFSGGTNRYGFKKNPFSFLCTKKFEHEIGNDTHEVSRNLSLIKEFGAAEIARPSLYPSVADYKAIEQYQDDPYVCMAPTSVWHTKQLPSDKWVELIKQLDGKTIFLLGSKDDFDHCDMIRKNCDSKKVINLSGRLNLLQSAALIKNAERTYVNDSGPMHIASAMNAPITVFFCSTVPSFGFGPLSNDSKIIEVENLDCRPCGLHGHKECPKGHFKCGMELVVKP